MGTGAKKSEQIGGSAQSKSNMVQKSEQIQNQSKFDINPKTEQIRHGAKNRVNRRHCKNQSKSEIQHGAKIRANPFMNPQVPGEPN